MSKQVINIRGLEPQCKAFTDATGLVWIENGSAGIGHTCHPNIEANKITRKSGPKKGYSLESHGFLFNTADYIASDAMDLLAAKHCKCGGRHK